MTVTFNEFLTILPVAFVTVFAVILLVVDLFIPKGRKSLTALLAALILAAGLGIDLAMMGRDLPAAFNGMTMLDGFAVFANALILLCGLAGVALAHNAVQWLHEALFGLPKVA